MMGCVMSSACQGRPESKRNTGIALPRTIEDVLSDCLIRTVMKADGVDPAELEATLRRVARRLAKRRDNAW